MVVHVVNRQLEFCCELECVEASADCSCISTVSNIVTNFC